MDLGSLKDTAKEKFEQVKDQAASKAGDMLGSVADKLKNSAK